MDLPEYLSPPPEKEAISLALDKVVFEELGGEPPLKAYLLLDASQSADIAVCAEAFPEPSRCLFDGASFEDLGDVGPWLIELKRHGAACETYFFKFYRPEHLNTFIPMFEPDQQARFMDGIEGILAEKHEVPETLLTHRFDAEAGFSTEDTDLLELGKPLMVQPPSQEDVEKILADI